MWRRGLGLALAALVPVWRRTCRTRWVDDPRPELRGAGRSYVLALLHAHQIGALLANDEPSLAAMVSRSTDGELLVPALRTRGVEAVRGSARSAGRDKGGRTALDALSLRLLRGVPVLLAVDGPRGPRGRVRLGAAELAIRTGAPVVPLAVVASRRWVLGGTWDGLQVPRPFSTLSVTFGAPVHPRPGVAVGPLRSQIEAGLRALEERCEYENGRGGSPARRQDEPKPSL